MKKLYKFSWDLYYAQCEGLFISTDEELKQYLGRDLNFGEIEGKHSETCGVLAEEDVEMVSDDPVFIDLFERNIGSFGYNPIDQIKNS